MVSAYMEAGGLVIVVCPQAIAAVLLLSVTLLLALEQCLSFFTGGCGLEVVWRLLLSGCQPPRFELLQKALESTVELYYFVAAGQGTKSVLKLPVEEISGLESSQRVGEKDNILSSAALL